jgi:hypothetical protein
MLPGFLTGARSVLAHQLILIPASINRFAGREGLRIAPYRDPPAIKRINASSARRFDDTVYALTSI